MTNKTTAAEIDAAHAALKDAMTAHAEVVAAKHAAAGVPVGRYDRALDAALQRDPEVNAAYDRMAAAQREAARLERRAARGARGRF